MLNNTRIGNNANICENGSNCDIGKKESSSTLVIEIVVPIAVATLLFVIAFLILHRTRKNQGNTSQGNN